MNGASILSCVVRRIMNNMRNTPATMLKPASMLLSRVPSHQPMPMDSNNRKNRAHTKMMILPTYGGYYIAAFIHGTEDSELV